MTGPGGPNGDCSNLQPPGQPLRTTATARVIIALIPLWSSHITYKRSGECIAHADFAESVSERVKGRKKERESDKGQRIGREKSKEIRRAACFKQRVHKSTPPLRFILLHYKSIHTKAS